LDGKAAPVVCETRPHDRPSSLALNWSVVPCVRPTTSVWPPNPC